MKTTEGRLLALFLATLFVGVSLFLYDYTKPTDTTKTQEDNHTVTTIVTTKNPDGTTKITETIDSKTKTKTLVQVPQTKRLNVSVLVANDFSNSVPKPLYGVSVTKEVLGNVTLGIFGLTSGVIGGSIGYDF